MWLSWIVVGAASLATMRAALDRGDIDEAARQGSLAGPTVVETGLAAPDRPAQLAAIAAAPSTTGRAELLAPLVRVAGGGDRRTAIPAARAARTIARDFRRRDRPDDIADEDVAEWRDGYLALARDRDRWIELRVLALDTAIALDASIDLAPLLAEPDPGFQRAAIAVIPAPVPVALRAPLAAIVAKATDPDTALAAAAVLCADLAVDAPAPVLAALGATGLERIKSLAGGRGSKANLRDARRCLR